MKRACFFGAIGALVILFATGAYAEEFVGEFRLTEASGLPGAEVSVPMIVRGNKPIQGCMYSLDFDEEVLQAVGVDALGTKPDGSPWDFAVHFWSNENETPGSAGVDEGYVVGAIVFALREEVTLPADTDVSFLAFRFQIIPEAPGGASTELSFIDGGGGPPPKSVPIANFLTMWGQSADPVNIPASVLINGRINIVGDLSLFVRGDANSDGTVNLSDAVTVLNYLFLGSSRPGCVDAADANDDGRLDIADPVRILNSLFLSGPPLPPPSGSAGEDLTPDDLECARGTS
jgi:hypothetical protein